MKTNALLNIVVTALQACCCLNLKCLYVRPGPQSAFWEMVEQVGAAYHLGVANDEDHMILGLNLFLGL